MYIQYVGFKVAASARIYNFDVLDTREEAREFTVKVQSEAFRPARLKAQDGPGICFERLEQELEGETQESRAEAHLSIGERDIQEYLKGCYRVSRSQRKRHRMVRGRAESLVPAGLTRVELNAPCNRKQSSPLRTTLQ